MISNQRRSKLIIILGILFLSGALLADWDRYRQTGESYGYGTYTNWRDVDGRTQTVVAWINDQGEVVDEAYFDSSTGENEGGRSFAGEDFGSWHESTFGWGGGSTNPCGVFEVCYPTEQL